MDLISVHSYSNKTSADIGNKCNDEGDEYIEFAAYYNHILRNCKTTREKPISNRRYPTRQNENSDRTFKYISTPGRSKSIPFKIKDDYVIEPRTTKSKKLLMKNLALSFHNLETKMYDSNHVTCSKNIPNNEFKPTITSVNTNDEQYQYTSENNGEPKFAEKTTYCRPAINMYNHELIYKTMERNARLQGLLRRLVLAREKEKQEVAWNNYINELKNKHRYCANDSRVAPDYTTEYTNTDIIDDCYNTRFTWKQSNPCQNLLQDFYSASDEIQSDNHEICGQRPLRYTPHNYENTRHCFPTSSQGRLMMKNQERQKKQPHSRTTSRYYRGNTIVVDKDNGLNMSNQNKTRKFMTLNEHQVLKSLSVQTDLNMFNKNMYAISRETFKDKYARVSSNAERLKQKVMQSENDVKHCSLASIENKLDVLINSINAFIVEVKSKRVNTRSEAVSCKFSDITGHINKTKSDTFGLLRREQIVCGMVQEKPRSTLTFNEGKYLNTIDDILYEEMHKSDRAKKDIHNILNESDRSGHIAFDIPTKERSTEITDSLYKTDKVVVQEIGCENNQRMTIAVNTDPLGLLALFRVSAETVKQILSYMPQLDYFSYLSRLPIPQMSRNGAVSHFVCNICGAAFARPSQLSDHIQEHNLGNSRDCCVCRHVLDMQRHRSGVFSCRHCGQTFTRAYCRELHQHDCARRLGRRLGRRPDTDVSPGLMLLR